MTASNICLIAVEVNPNAGNGTFGSRSHKTFALCSGHSAWLLQNSSTWTVGKQ